MRGHCVFRSAPFTFGKTQIEQPTEVDPMIDLPVLTQKVNRCIIAT